MLYGLTFSAGDESFQFAFDTAGLDLFARTTSGGVFGNWKHLCGSGQSSQGDETTSVERAEIANRAYQLASPMTILFTGDVSGEVSFDGSQNVTAALSIKRDGGDPVTADAVRNIIKEELGSGGTGRPPYRLIEEAIVAAINRHLDEAHTSHDKPGG